MGSKCAQWHVLAMAASGKENVYDVVAMEFVGTFINGFVQTSLQFLMNVWLLLLLHFEEVHNKAASYTAVL